jgi:hypothetical protein
MEQRQSSYMNLDKEVYRSSAGQQLFDVTPLAALNQHIRNCESCRSHLREVLSLTTKQEEKAVGLTSPQADLTTNAHKTTPTATQRAKSGSESYHD